VAQYGIETTAPISALNNQTTSGGLYTSLLSDSRYILKGQIQYDVNANPSVSTKSADMNISYIWDYRHALPIANVKNAGQADIAYTSFEADGSGNWSIPAGGITSGSAITGTSSYNLSNGNITRSGLTPSTTYVVSYWSSSYASYSISGTTKITAGKLINGWTYFEHTVTGVSSLSITGGGGIDELRLYPANAQMTTYTYLPSIGISSACDADNRVTYYQYDGLGRLQVEKDQDGNIIKTYQYHYQQ
jgi:YD repeat-containing protein